LIIKTVPYSLTEMISILSIRAMTENIELEEEALAELGKIGAKTSLRYVVQLLTPAKILAESQGKTKVEKGEIQEVNSLFFDAKSSAKLLQAQSSKYIC